MAAPKKKSVARFIAHNSEDIESKHKALQSLWRILSKMDEKGTVFVNDIGIIGLDGDVPSDRTPKKLGLKNDEIALIQPYAIYDGPEADDQESATGVILTTYQLLEAAFDLGAQSESAKVTASMTRAADANGAEEEAEEEESEEEEEEEDEDMDVLDEDDDEYDNDEDED